MNTSLTNAIGLNITLDTVFRLAYVSVHVIHVVPVLISYVGVVLDLLSFLIIVRTLIFFIIRRIYT